MVLQMEMEKLRKSGQIMESLMVEDALLSHIERAGDDMSPTASMEEH